MLKTTLLACLLIASLTVVIQQEEERLSRSISQHNVQFTNDTSCATKAQINHFIRHASNATKLFPTDFQKSMAYLTDVMNTFEELPNIRYFVFIQQKKETIYSYNLFAKRGFCMAMLAGINNANPSWSYMFIRFTNPPNLDFYNYIAYAGKGPKITPQIEGYIFRTVTAIEPAIPCDCSATNPIQTKMQTGVGQGDWSVICDNSYDLNAYIAPLSGKWIYAQPSRCHYLIFAS